MWASSGHSRAPATIPAMIEALTFDQLLELTAACRGPYADIVLVLGVEGLRSGELAGLQVGDLVATPGPGLRISRAVLSSRGGGKLFVDSVGEVTPTSPP